MNDQVGFSFRGRNPDVLTCIANLSNDEVFTPPEFANRMLDTLTEAWAADHDGADLWADSSVRSASRPPLAWVCRSRLKIVSGIMRSPIEMTSSGSASSRLGALSAS